MTQQQEGYRVHYIQNARETDESSIINNKLTRTITISFLLRQTTETYKAVERSILDAPPSSERRAPRTEATET